MDRKKCSCGTFCRSIPVDADLSGGASSLSDFLRQVPKQLDQPRLFVQLGAKARPTQAQ